MLSKMFGNYSEKELKRIKPISDKVLSLDEEYSKISNEALRKKTEEFKTRLSNGENLDDILPEAYAVCREAGWRTIGLKAYPVQIIGGIILHQGRIAELKTGEGKALLAAMPAYLNALTGRGVHVVTVNDYLAKRDCEQLGKIFRFLGLTVGLVVHDMDSDARRAAYACDITYGTNNEFGFDYLRDNMVIHKDLKVQREHNYVIIDEVDSILIDEARTPLIISGRGGKNDDMYIKAEKFASELTYKKVKELDEWTDVDDVVENEDCVINEKTRTVTLTEHGIAKAEIYFNISDFYDEKNLVLQHKVNQAIKAHGVMQKNINYIVKDDNVLLIDEFTGRIMPGRQYNDGLHQAIEAKEGIFKDDVMVTNASITFQNYFRLYDKLSGMTGTAATERDEFQQVYGLDVIEVPTNKPVIRKDMPDVVYKNERVKFNEIADYIAELHSTGQPVLVGTVSVEKSEQLSEILTEKNIPHNVLNAKNHELEAEIIAQAGKLRAVTISTNMAGRGTDIKLGGNPEFLAKREILDEGCDEDDIEEAIGYSETDNAEILKIREKYNSKVAEHKVITDAEGELVKQVGGLAVIGTERHESRRIDNQLRGRAGRQGDPGMSRFFLSLEDDVIRLYGGAKVAALMDNLNIEEDLPIDSKIVSAIVENAQKTIESLLFGTRKRTIEFDDVLNEQRKVIYEQRDRVLNHEPLKEKYLEEINSMIDIYVDVNYPEMAEIRKRFGAWINFDEYGFNTSDELKTILKDRVNELYKYGESHLMKEVGDAPFLRELERQMLLTRVDRSWQVYVDSCERLKKEVGLNAMGQKDPVMEFKFITADMFDEMNAEIISDSVCSFLKVVSDYYYKYKHPPLVQQSTIIIQGKKPSA